MYSTAEVVAVKVNVKSSTKRSRSEIDPKVFAAHKAGWNSKCRSINKLLRSVACFANMRVRERKQLSAIAIAATSGRLVE